MNRSKNKRNTRKSGRSAKIKVIIPTLCAIALFAAVLIADGRYIRFDIDGEEEIEAEYAEPFNDPGFRAVTVGRLFGESAKKVKVTADEKVDTNKLGPQKIKYSARFMFKKYTIERTVNVVDTTPPKITLNHTDGYAPNWLDGYKEEGYTAVDTHDGDVTDKVRREEEGNKIKYTATDSSGNTATAVRLSVFDGTLPEIMLVGGSETEQHIGRKFKDPGFSASDAKGDDLSGLVHTESFVKPNVPGEYKVHYYIENKLGGIVEAWRKVTVLPASGPPQAIEPDGKTIYLTFDDGPGAYTDKLLDILAKYDVKATFFVTCMNKSCADCIGRAFREGHSIGAHSATHIYEQIYAGEDAFFADLDQVQALIYEQTGEYTDLIRFPGGSSNTVSSFNPGIMTRLTSAVIERGYQYFDWNVSSGDAGGTISTSQVYNNIINGCAGNDYSVVLQHDIKGFSVDAVEDVILWGKANGYTFRPLTIHSPAAHHGIAN